MTKRKPVRIGPYTIRPFVKKGVLTGQWELDIPPDCSGTSKRTRRLFDTLRKAENEARELRRQAHPVTGEPVVQLRRTGLTLQPAFQQYHAQQISRAETRKKRYSSIETDAYRAKALFRFLGDLDLGAITENRVNAYQRHRLKQGIKPVTINDETAFLTRVLAWANKNGYRVNLSEIEQIPVRPVHPDIPTPQEVVRIIDALPDRLRPVITFLAETGCRIGEALNLTWDCVDLDQGIAHIRSKDGWTPKTMQSERPIFLSDGLLTIMSQLPAGGSYVFPGAAPDKPIWNLRRSWNRAVRKAGIKRNGEPATFPPKSLRKALATWQSARGIDESVLQRHLGHAPGSRITRQHYVQATERALRNAVFQLPAGNDDGQIPAA